jgi:hypothetical protein
MLLKVEKAKSLREQVLFFSFTLFEKRGELRGVAFFVFFFFLLSLLQSVPLTHELLELSTKDVQLPGTTLLLSRSRGRRGIEPHGEAAPCGAEKKKDLTC